jgi:hypothetical protein
MIVEFFAPPGAGKSFISNILYDYIRNSIDWIEYKVILSNDLLTYKKSRRNWLLRKFEALLFYFPALNIVTFKLIVRILHKYGYGKIGKDLSMYALGIFARYIKAHRLYLADKFIVIMDEGVSQIARLFWKDDALFENLPKYYESLRRSGILPRKDSVISVYVRSSIEDSLLRINMRDSGWPRIFRDLDVEKRMSLLSQFHYEISIVLRYLSTESHVVEIDNTLAMNYNEKTLKNQLDEILKPLIDLKSC